MKQKEVEDVFGGKEEFANADSVASKSRSFRGVMIPVIEAYSSLFYSSMSR